MKLISKGVFATAVAVVTILGYQGFNAAKALGTAGDVALIEWVKANPERADVADRYVAECLHPGLPRNKPVVNQVPKPVLSMDECGDRIGDRSLIGAIQAAQESVVVPAPLGWLI